MGKISYPVIIVQLEFHHNSLIEKILALLMIYDMFIYHKSSRRYKSFSKMATDHRSLSLIDADCSVKTHLLIALLTVLQTGLGFQKAEFVKMLNH